MSVYFNIEGQKLSPSGDTFIASRTLAYPECIFNFDDEWNGFSKVATFHTSNSELYYKAIVDDSNFPHPNTR